MRTLAFILITSTIFSLTSLQAQDNTETQADYYLGASAFISLLPLPLNLSIDALKYSGRAYHGVTFGLRNLYFRKIHILIMEAILHIQDSLSRERGILRLKLDLRIVKTLLITG